MANTGQRRHKRFEVRDVKGSLLFRTQVKLRNVSVSGLSFETTERLKLGRAYSLRLSNSGESVDLTGTIRWCHLAGTRAMGEDSLPVYEAGLAFDDVFTDRAQAVIRFIERHVILPLEKRITGRFTLETIEPVRTQLDAAVDSRFGMELGLRDEIVSVHGRVASVSRGVGTREEPLSELGIEFVQLPGEVRDSLTRFISQELE